MSKDKILVIDPDENVRNMLNIYFTGQGYEVVCVADGVSALKAAQDRDLPDVIVTELALPDMDGYALRKQLSTIPRTSKIPIIFLKQQTEHERNTKLVDLVGSRDEFIYKPFDVEELKLSIQNSISWLEPIKKIDYITNFPKGAYTEDHLRQLIKTKRSW